MDAGGRPSRERPRSWALALASRLGAAWNVVSGTVDDLKAPAAVFVDQLYRDKLGVAHVGQIVEIGGRRASVPGEPRLILV